MAKMLAKAAGLLLGILLALLAAYLALNLPVLLKAVVARNWLYNVDTAALEPKLFFISVATLLASTVLIVILLRGRLKKIPGRRLLPVVGLFWLLLVPLKNSSTVATLFFAVSGSASVLIFVSSPGLKNTSQKLLAAVWEEIIGLSSGKWQALTFVSGLSFYLLCAIFLFNRIPHIIDEIDYLFQAKIFAAGKLWAPLPEPFEFFQFVNLIGGHGKWLSQYPPGWPALLAVGVKTGMPWLINPLIGGAIIILIYRLAREMFDEETGRLASLLGLFSPYLIIMNSTMMSHSSAGAALLLFLLLLWQGLRLKSSLRIFAAFLFLGVASSIRPYTAFLIGLAGLGLLLVDLKKAPGPTFKLMVSGALGLVIPAALLLYYNHLTTGSALVFGYQYLYGQTIKLGFGLRQFPFEHSLVEGLKIFHARLLELSRNLLQSPVPALAFAALPFGYKKFDRNTVFLAAVFLILPAGYVFYFFNDLFYTPRFLFESAPALVILCAVGIKLAAGKWQNKAETSHYGLILISLAFFIFIPGHILSYRTAGDIGPELEQAIKQNKLKGGLVLIENLYFPMGMIRQSPFLDADNVYARDLADRRQEIIDRFPGKPVWLFFRDTSTKQFILKPLGQEP